MLFRTLLVSLLCHLVLLSSWPFAERSSSSGELPKIPLQVVRIAGVGAEVTDFVRPERARGRPVEQVSRAAKNKLTLASGKGAARSDPLPASISPLRERAALPTAGMPATATESVAPAPEGAGRAPPASAEAPSLDVLRQYRLALAREARRHKRYPALARERGWEGMVTIAIQVPLAGAAPQLSIGRSSGNDYLDALALEMMAQSVRALDLPDGLKGRGFVIEVPVRYALDD